MTTMTIPTILNYDKYDLSGVVLLLFLPHFGAYVANRIVLCDLHDVLF